MNKINKNTPNLIGISGKAGSGKDLVGKIIQYLIYCNKFKVIDFEEYDMHSLGYSHPQKIKKFAYKVTTSYKEITGINFHKLSREEKEIERSKYVKYANKCKEIFGEDVWVNALFCDYKAPTQIAIERTGGYCNHPEPTKFPNWIITDVRFPNEAKAIKDRGGILIRVNRLNSTSQTIYINKRDRTHPSETELDSYSEFDYAVDNNSSIEDLIEKVREILIKEKLIC
jgi:hypothetical protein